MDEEDDFDGATSEDTVDEDEEDVLGSQPCTLDNVRASLIRRGIDEEKAEELVQDHIDKIEHGVDMGSFTYAVVDEIIEEM